ncbi:hypothetical protein AOQ84DRAFT_227527 [Glonium stellatum]|uniref:Uncharacterized protein n=1 Tax=Glonium stellatum TaxID=574774 RepID=A0A8E2ERL6_9PEZI|nr:hypothetical protein AOQ84DRAFT_227527 [Glonium stellatum]
MHIISLDDRIDDRIGDRIGDQIGNPGGSLLHCDAIFVSSLHHLPLPTIAAIATIATVFTIATIAITTTTTTTTATAATIAVTAATASTASTATTKSRPMRWATASYPTGRSVLVLTSSAFAVFNHVCYRGLGPRLIGTSVMISRLENFHLKSSTPNPHHHRRPPHFRS